MAGAPTALGFVSFAGYTYAAWALNRFFQSKENSVWRVGAAPPRWDWRRVRPGAVCLFCWRLPSTRPEDTAIPPRCGISQALFPSGLWFFYLRNKENRARLLGGAGAGTVWSFALDAIGVGAALVVPGGVWVC